jgi:membrane-bound serine protease (ClpP class)
MAEIVALIVVLAVAALVLFLLEMFTPTFGVLTILGVLTMGVAAWLSFTYVSWILGAILVVAAMLAIPVYFVIMPKVLPETWLGRKLFLRREDKTRADGTPEAHEENALIGKSARAETTLRPSGAIRVEGVRRIARAEQGIIEKGAEVKVIGSDGINLVVRPVGKHEEAPE